MSSSRIRTIVAVTGGLAAVGALLYFLFREDKSEEEGKEEGTSERSKNAVLNKDTFGDSASTRESNEAVSVKREPEDGSDSTRIVTDYSLNYEISKPFESYTKEDMLHILDEILESQNCLKSVMKKLTGEFVENPPSDFQECYDKVKRASPQDPLDRRRISLSEFDRLVEKFYTDDKVSDTIEKIMGINGSSNISSGGTKENGAQVLGKIENINDRLLININEFMLKELRDFVGQYSAASDKHVYDVKTLTIAAQVWVGSRVEKQFNLSSDEIETAMLARSQYLRDDPDFERISFQMQTTMEQLIGSPAPSNLPFSI